MAMPGFLGQDIGGYNQGPNLTGEAGVPTTGINYGDILGAALKYGSSQGSSGPMFGGMIQNDYGGKGAPSTSTGQQAQGLPPMDEGNAQGAQSSGASQQGLSEMLKYLLAAWGVGV